MTQEVRSFTSSSRAAADTYKYSGVDQGTFASFMKAKSEGLFHSRHIRDNKHFPFTKINPTPPRL
jgi:hypothetical protein